MDEFAGHLSHPAPDVRALGAGGIARARMRPRRGWIDLAVLILVAGVFAAFLQVGREWRAPSTQAVAIDLSLRSLPLYTVYSLSRGLAAYLVSLLFTLIYGYWAAHDPFARRILLPLLDVLQSVPVLGFMPGVVLACVALFPDTRTGLEIAAVLMIFTAQVWNMTFCYFHSLLAVPTEHRELASIYRFGRWRTLCSIELPGAVVGLVWNSMMSMAGGWFFLMINESFRLGDRDFRLPGIGAYMSVASERGDRRAMVAGVAAMVVMIVAVDQLLWRPVVVWAQRFRHDDTARGDLPGSWFLSLLRRSRLVRSGAFVLRRGGAKLASRGRGPVVGRARYRIPQAALRLLSRIFVAGWVVLGCVAAGIFLRHAMTVPPSEWLTLFTLGGLTLFRVLAAVAIGSLWTVPAGIAIGLSPSLSRLAQPVVQVIASFPAPMLFPAVLGLLSVTGIPLSVGSVALLLLGTQWYILFNVIAGASAIPSDLREMGESFGLSRWQCLTRIYLPSVFPSLLTGWITASGGAWNASIVAEFVEYRGKTLETAGLGQWISRAAFSAQYSQLVAGVTVMALIVTVFHRFVWQPCSRFAEQRCTLNR